MPVNNRKDELLARLRARQPAGPDAPAGTPISNDPTPTTPTGVDNVDTPLPPNAGQPTDPGPSVTDTNRPPPGTVSPIDVQGPAPTDDGIPKTSLNPTGNPVKLTTAMKVVVKPASEALDLDVINAEFNPFKAMIGEFTDPAEMYVGKAFIPTRDLIGGVIQAGGGDPAAMAPVLAALPEASVYKGAGQQFAINGADKAPGNRVVTYGGDVGHKNLDHLVQELGKQGIRLAKVMMHINHESQGGPVSAIVEDGVAGTTHTGGFSAGMKGGKPFSIRSDWPSDYGTLDDGNRTYNAHLVGIDYQAGTSQQVPKPTIQAWKQNADMIDAFAGVVVPFASGDLDPRYTNYKFNPLEVHDSSSANAVMADLASLDRDTLLQKHGAFYCAEGQFSVASMGWQSGCLLKKSAFENTQAGKLIEAFQQAPGLERDANGKITNPDVGWQHLEDEGLIDASQHRALKDTGRDAIALEWVPEDIQGVQSYGPHNAEGMVSEPMSVATMAWSLLRTYMPREGMARAMAADIAKAFATGDATVQAGISGLIGGANPTTPQGQQALGALCMKAASGLLLKVLGSDDFRDKLLQKAGFDEITNDADKAKVMGLYQEFVGTLQSADLSDQAALDKAVKDIDTKFKNLEVERNDFDPLTGATTGQRMGVMMYAAPQCFTFWTQQPELTGNSGALRYVATAQHADQAV